MMVFFGWLVRVGFGNCCGGRLLNGWWCWNIFGCVIVRFLLKCCGWMVRMLFSDVSVRLFIWC